MDREPFIQSANAIFNRALSTGLEGDIRLSPDFHAEDPDLAAQIEEAFQAARQPDTFFDALIWRQDVYFEMGYELLRITFDPDVLDPRSHYIGWMKDRTEPPPDLIMMGRFWRVSGRHRYAPDGQLLHFEFDPFVATESIASVLVANYFTHESAVLGKRVGVGAIGYLATRPALRGKGGHGRYLTAAFETALQQRAADRGDYLLGAMLESEDRARQFWSKMGFRYAEGSRYMQPPLNYNPETGEPTSNTAPETFMIKRMDGAPTESIDRTELLEWLRLMYERWYSPELNNDAATARARALVFDELFGIFRDSLPNDSNPIPLISS
jgi:GNAT superfamily N-acetyltransferase